MEQLHETRNFGFDLLRPGVYRGKKEKEKKRSRSLNLISKEIFLRKLKNMLFCIFKTINNHVRKMRAFLPKITMYWKICILEDFSNFLCQFYRKIKFYLLSFDYAISFPPLSLSFLDRGCGPRLLGSPIADGGARESCVNSAG